jgi:cholesterol transport system auxiliary component
MNLKQPPEKISYYSFEYDSPNPGVKKQLPFVLRVKRFQISPLYASNKIVFRDAAFKRDVYAYHRWHSNPRDMVSYFFARDLKAYQAFKAVFSVDDSTPCSYTIDGAVEEFFEQDNADSWEAVLSLEITLSKEEEPDASKRIVMQKSYRTRQTCSQKNPASLAEAMSKAMSEISGNIISDVYRKLSAVSVD